MVDLGVEFLGVEFKSPILLSSAPPTLDADHIKRAVEAGFGGGVTKTISYRQFHDPKPRFQGVKGRNRLFGMQNIEHISTYVFDLWIKEFKVLRELKKTHGTPIVASIMAGTDLDEWARLAKDVEAQGADIIELNVSCPHMSDSAMGAFIGQDCPLTGEVSKAAAEAVSVPIMTKLTPNVTDIASIAKEAIKGGAKGVAAINTVLVLSGVDINTGNPLPDVWGKGGFGGYSGPAVRPIGLRMVGEIAREGINISGIGGIESWENVIEYMMMGAGTVQLATAAMWYGFDIVKGWNENILTFMKEHGYDSLADLKGITLPKITELEKLDYVKEVYSDVDTERCIDCRRCVTACRDGATDAMKNPKLNDVDYEKCVGCGLCKMVCPQNCISMIINKDKK